MNKQNLSTGWRFSLDKTARFVQPYVANSSVPEEATATCDDSTWQEIFLPHDWETAEGYAKAGDGATAYALGGVGWYRNRFVVASESKSNAPEPDGFEPSDSGSEPELSESDAFEPAPNCPAFLEFDGVYNNAEVWLNGHYLGFHANGYAPFFYDISPYVVAGENLLALRVDRTRYVDSRWYTGSGIYRSVNLYTKKPLFFPLWTTAITTPVISEDSAEVVVAGKVVNSLPQLNLPEPSLPQSAKVEIVTDIISTLGSWVSHQSQTIVVASQTTTFFTQNLTIRDPKLWSPDNPYLYRVVQTLLVDGEVFDTETYFLGVRSFRYDTEEGFFLNEQSLKIKGVCLHHDGGLVGAAVPKDLWRQRLTTLKDCGCNAIRSAHNPASSEFLDLCDEMGFLVQEEFFDEWDNPKDKRFNSNEQHTDYLSRGYTEHFQESAEADLKNTIRCHKNHPSIFQWSIGNEIEWTYPRNVQSTGFFGANASGNYFWETPPNSIAEIQHNLATLPTETYDIGKTAQELAAWVKEEDTTRPVIANCILPSASFEAGYTDALDIVGFSYRRVIYDYAKQHYPEKICMGTENLGQWHEWKAVLERPFIAGLFLWTGIDYLGEAHRKGWPTKSQSSGLLDLAGFPKPSYYMFKALWQDTPCIKLYTQREADSIYQAVRTTTALRRVATTDSSATTNTSHPVEKEPGAWKRRLWGWHPVNNHWNYEEGETVIVEAYTNCQEAELFLNNASCGVVRLADFEDNICRWVVPFAKGTVRVEGRTPLVQDAEAHEASCVQTLQDQEVVRAQTVQDTLVTAGKPVTIALHCQLSTDKVMNQETAAQEVAKKRISDLKTTVTVESARLKCTASIDIPLLAQGNCIRIEAQLIDAKGNPVRHVEEELNFIIAPNGFCEVLGFDNGSRENVQHHQQSTITTHHGRALALVRVL